MANLNRGIRIRKNNRYTVAFLLISSFVFAGCSSVFQQSEKRIEAPLNPVPTNVFGKPGTRITPTYPVSKTQTAIILSNNMPGEPEGSAQVIHDQTCFQTANEKRAAGGDEYSTGRFERPFDRDMHYLPALDISRAELFRPKDGWIYFRIHLEDKPATAPSIYGIELDLDIDGRGDYLIQVSAPESPDWDEVGIRMWWDSDGDVGGQVINRSDPVGFKGSGFETLKVDTNDGKNPGQIWTRLNGKGLEIAVSEDLVGGVTGKFTWKPFTDGVPFSSTLYDLNDYFLLDEAGSANQGEREYPLKEVFAIDNTCRGLSGLTPSGNEQGVCPP